MGFLYGVPCTTSRKDLTPNTRRMISRTAMLGLARSRLLRGSGSERIRLYGWRGSIQRLVGEICQGNDGARGASTRTANLAGRDSRAARKNGPGLFFDQLIPHRWRVARREWIRQTLLRRSIKHISVLLAIDGPSDYLSASALEPLISLF